MLFRSVPRVGEITMFREGRGRFGLGLAQSQAKTVAPGMVAFHLFPYFYLECNHFYFVVTYIHSFVLAN